MKTISGWRDLEPFGIDALTGEACGLMYRLLCDVTEPGRRIIETCLGCRITPAEPWNRGTDESPHIGSVMLSLDFLLPLGVFALLENGCRTVWLMEDRTLLGFEPDDSPESVPGDLQTRRIVRTFSYGGTAGDRNVHAMSGRVV
jgi:hypothetical protein